MYYSLVGFLSIYLDYFNILMEDFMKHKFKISKRGLEIRISSLERAENCGVCKLSASDLVLNNFCRTSYMAVGTACVSTYSW
jgi:hypothetical protein